MSADFSSNDPARNRDAGGALAVLTAAALRIRSQGRYAAHPIEAALQYHSAAAGIACETGDVGLSFATAESHYRAGAQGLRLSEIPQLPGKLQELSRLSACDRAGRKQLRLEAERRDWVLDEEEFARRWIDQGKPGGAEHHVYHDEGKGRWVKRLYHAVNHSTLGDYFSRMRLHAALFPATAYWLEGFLVNARSKALTPVVSQPHVKVDTDRSLVTRRETHALMAGMGFAPLELMHEGVRDDGYFAYLHPVTGVLVHDVHDENIVRPAGVEAFAVIDPYLSLARRGTWAAIKLSEIGYDCLPDDAPEADSIGDGAKAAKAADFPPKNDKDP